MRMTRRLFGAATAVAATASLLTLAPTAQAAGGSAAAITAGGGATCTNVRELGTKKVVVDRGMSAFTVRQYIGWCKTSNGTGWRNFASTYVWDQYHRLGLSYRAISGIAVTTHSETEGFVVGSVRQRLVYSRPVGTTKQCTRGWGKLYRLGTESNQGMSTLVC